MKFLISIDAANDQLMLGWPLSLEPKTKDEAQQSIAWQREFMGKRSSLVLANPSPSLPGVFEYLNPQGKLIPILVHRGPYTTTAFDAFVLRVWGDEE